MEEMAAIQTQIAEADIEFAPLRPPRISQDPQLLQQSSQPPRPARLSLSDTYSADICTAAIRTIPKKTTSDRTRVILKDIKSNKIARRTLQAMVIFGVVTLLYQSVSLVPAFQGLLATYRGLQIQVQSEADSRQNVAYGFLSECSTRKV
jgi:hypothetical protein